MENAITGPKGERATSNVWKEIRRKRNVQTGAETLFLPKAMIPNISDISGISERLDFNLSSDVQLCLRIMQTLIAQSKPGNLT